MKKIKRKWYLFYGKVLAFVVSLFGVSSCGLIGIMQPSMYGVPIPDHMQKDSLREPEIRAMYGVKPVPFRRENVIEKEGVDIEIKQD